MTEKLNRVWSKTVDDLTIIARTVDRCVYLWKHEIGQMKYWQSSLGNAYRFLWIEIDLHSYSIILLGNSGNFDRRFEPAIQYKAVCRFVWKVIAIIYRSLESLVITMCVLFQQIISSSDTLYFIRYILDLQKLYSLVVNVMRLLQLCFFVRVTCVEKYYYVDVLLSSYYLEEE